MNPMVLLVLISIALVGCATRGEYMKQSDVTSLQSEIVTASQLEERLGPPSVTIPRGDGKIKWVYQGVQVTAGATSYIPYVSIFAGINHKECSRLTVLVDQQTGELSDWQYEAEKDVDHWSKTNEKCGSGKTTEAGSNS